MLMRAERIKVEPVSFSSLMHDMASGQLRVPRFQRMFVWEKPRIQALLDSMYKEYPIGTIFLWRAPAKYNDMLRTVDYLKQPEISRDQPYTLILDGQQRLTSLYITLNGLKIGGEDYGRIVADLAPTEQGKIFQVRDPDNQRWIAIKDLLASNFALFDALPAEYRPQFMELSKRLSAYPFSVVTVTDMEFDDAIEIFERINQQSKALTRYDLIAASILTDSFDLRERAQSDIIGPLKKSFGSIAETSIPQALALNIKKNTEHATQMGLLSQDVQPVWARTVECLKLAVEFVYTNLGVCRVDFLPYAGLLPVLAHYFYEGQTNSVKSLAHREQIEKWFWRTAFSERYSGASQTRMTEDAAMLRSLAKDNTPIELDRLPVSIDERILIEASMTSKTSAIRNGFLCLLNLLTPLHFVNASEIAITGEDFSSFTKAERHHIFPASFLRNHFHKARIVHRVPNFCFIPSDLNKQISDAAPSEYFGQLKELHGDSGNFERIMKSHLIPIDEDSGIWNDDYDLFLMQRARLLLREIRIRCGLSSRVSEQQRNPILDDIEGAIRETIHNTLSANLGLQYWRQAIPADIRDKVEDRIQTLIRNVPGTTRSQFSDLRKMLDQVDVADYPKIILSGTNWPHFSPIFRQKEDCQRFLNDFRIYRNAVKHGQGIDSLLESRGQTAILWLSKALDVDLGKYGIS